jgi:hypothetical protein
LREELLAHLESIYDQEYARLNDPDAAFRHASQRFGDPADLSREFQRNVPLQERFSYRIERLFAWRAPESGSRYCLRMAVCCLILMVPMWLLAAMQLIVVGWHPERWFILRPITALLLLLPANQYLLGLLYLKIRDSLLGAFDRPQSLPTAIFLAALMAILVLASLFAFDVIAESNVSIAIEFLSPACAASIVIAIFYLLMARFRGPSEISDTLYASLDLTPAS